jgi:ubiquitin-conjugating enzyme E2 C
MNSSASTHISAPKSALASSGAVPDSASTLRRLQSELMQLMSAKTPGISAFPDGDNLFSWTGTIEGSAGTVYEGMRFKLHLRFSTNYPYSAPTVRFETACFHPNVDQYGNICLDILKDQWSAVYNIKTILLSIQSLLADPNCDSPLNGYAAQLWRDQPAYAKVLQQKYKEATSGSSTTTASS